MNDHHPEDPDRLDGDDDGRYCEQQFDIVASTAATGPLTATTVPLGLAGMIFGSYALLVLRRRAAHQSV